MINLNKTLNIDLADYIIINFAAISLHSLIADSKLNTAALDKWFSQYAALYAKYVPRAEKLGGKIENVIFHGNIKIFFDAFNFKDKTVAEYYASHFNKYKTVYYQDFERFESSETTYEIFLGWEKAMNVALKAAEYIQKYTDEHSDNVNDTIASGAKISADILKKYHEVHRIAVQHFILEKASAAAERLLSVIPAKLNELDDVTKKCVISTDISGFEIWKKSIAELLNDIDLIMVFSEKYPEKVTDKISAAQKECLKFRRTFNDAEETTLRRIKEFAAFKEQAIKAVQPVEGRMLDDQQLESIIIDDDNQLIIAGAGTGKTTTIIGKVKYLLNTGKCRHNDILLLSFTNKSAAEMKERLRSETGHDMDVMTFHKLGLEIIAGTDKKRPTIYSKSVQEFTRTDIKKHLNDPLFCMSMITYMFLSPSKYRTPFDFSTVTEYDEYIEANPPMTLKQERVKGYCEMEIANFLYTNNIRYTYEKIYECDTANEEYSGYHPDFYLEDHGIYIEFFAVDKNGNVPEFFSAKHGGTGQSEYLAGIEWKRETHKQNNTVLIELFYADKQDNKLIERLTEKLKEHNVPLTPMSDEKLWEEVSSSNKNLINSVCDVIGTAISLAKSKGYDMEKLCEIGGAQNAKLLRFIAPIYEDYSAMLQETGQIDFNDMIFKASEYVREGKVSHDYKYVIVDEYQDISMARFILLDELRKRSFFKLFCVGDDWQSIYRFAGSDISYILNFEYYWGKASISKIETTYRFSKQLIEISGSFIMKNPDQVKKSLRSNSPDTGFPIALINAYNDKYLIRFTEEKLHSLPKSSSVFFIGRYTFDKDMLKDSNFRLSYNNVTGTYEVNYPPRSDLKIEFITAHKSKGLQADYVFILNNKNKGMGFPSKIQDDPLIQQLLNNSDSYPYSEERRLFYVAMTRARKRLWLLVQQDNESVFAKELIRQYGQAMTLAEWTCPLCGGRLIKRTGKNGEFFGCSNFSKTGCKFTRNIARRNDVK